MRLCRFNDNRLGVVEGSEVYDVTAALDILPAYRYPLPHGDMLIAHLPAIRVRVTELMPSAARLPLSAVRLLSPVANPGKVIGAPVNYLKHLEEVREQRALNHGNASHSAPIHTAGVFLKATRSVVGPGEGVAVRLPDRRTDHEVELGLVIGRRASEVPVHEALSYVAGYVIGLDITIRGSEERSLRKSVDTYTVIGPWLVTADDIDTPGALDMRLTVNGEVRQQASTALLIMNCAELIAYASSFYTLEPGDILITGTPEGVSPIVPGDRIEASISQVGEMVVEVRPW
jgi:2-keto-4-pentenoate hydratase/2-oxohepta-3-ene-1,7-dioic acid hydratase in catechol pathway